MVAVAKGIVDRDSSLGRYQKDPVPATAVMSVHDSLQRLRGGGGKNRELILDMGDDA